MKIKIFFIGAVKFAALALQDLIAMQANIIGVCNLSELTIYPAKALSLKGTVTVVEQQVEIYALPSRMQTAHASIHQL